MPSDWPGGSDLLCNHLLAVSLLLSPRPLCSSTLVVALLLADKLHLLLMLLLADNRLGPRTPKVIVQTVNLPD